MSRQINVDVDLIDRAEHEIDLAAYVLTDWPIMQALTRAADWGLPFGASLHQIPSADRAQITRYGARLEQPLTWRRALLGP
jgi:phosphatidylserine/phosphatidylglycerophosphate/cardiolipin synthase-like enzyme